VSAAGLDFLFFAEDPGAANYVAPLARVVGQSGMSFRLLTRGPAGAYLRERGILAEALPAEGNPRELLAGLRPRVLVTGTSEDRDAWGLALIDAAQALGVRSVGAVDGPANSAFRFRGRGGHALFHRPDWLMVPDDWTKASYVGLGFAPGRIAVCGHPHHDVVRDAKRALDEEGRVAVRRRILPAAAGREIVAFLTELSVGLNEEEFRRSPSYTLVGHGSDRRTLVVLDEFLDAVALLPERPYLVLRIHPKDSTGGYTPYLAAFDHISDSGPPLDLVYAADLVVGMTSMLLLEAALLNRPTLSIVPRAMERDWLPSIGWGLTPCAYEPAAVRSRIAAWRQQATEARADPGLELGSERSVDLGVKFLASLIGDP
jgi:hypothetical protein